MANRILLNQSGLKVSKPGVNVLTASDGQLNFSSDWSGLSVYQRGSVYFNWSVSGLVGQFSQTVMLNKVFPNVPFVMFYWQFAGADVVAGYGSGFSITQSRQESAPSSVFAAVGQASTDRIVFSGMYSKKTSGVVAPDVTIKFIVMDHNF